MLTKKALLVAVLFACISHLPTSLWPGHRQAFPARSRTRLDRCCRGERKGYGASARVSSRESKTDDTGHYLIPLLPVGDYTIRVECPGLSEREQKDVRLQVDEHREVNFTLAPASVTSTIEVSATEVAVETTNPTLGQVITSQQVAELPLNGRDFVQLATLTPGHHAGDQSQQLLQRRPQQRSLGARNLFAFGRRIARPEHGLAARRQRQQRADRRRHCDFAFDRCHPGIQGSDLQLLGGIRYPRGSDRAGDHQVRNQRSSTDLCSSSSATPSWMPAATSRPAGNNSI